MHDIVYILLSYAVSYQYIYYCKIIQCLLTLYYGIVSWCYINTVFQCEIKGTLKSDILSGCNEQDLVRGRVSPSSGRVFH